MNSRSNLIISIISVVGWGIFYQPNIIESALALAFFVIVPVVLSMTDAEKWFSRYSFLFAWAGVTAVMLEYGFLSVLLAGSWLIFTAGVALNALRRLAARGFAPVEETIIDIGCMYLFVGGVWFVLSQTHADEILPYSSIIVDLTAVHFHYAAFLLPILTGMIGRWVYGGEKRITLSFRLLAIGVLLGPVLVAAAVDQGPPLEAILVGIYVVFLYWFSAFSIGISKRVGNIFSKVGLLVSSFILLFTMTLSVIYSLGRAIGIIFIDIPGMIEWHGAWNAFGFSFVALFSWFVLAPPARTVYNQFPISSLRGKANIANNLLKTHHTEKNKGLIETWDVYKRSDFHPEKLDSLVGNFYTNTTSFRMEARVTWKLPFLESLSSFFTKRMQQINIPESGITHMNGDIYALKDKEDGRPQPRIWMRQKQIMKEPIFTAAYSYHTNRGTTYFNIALPLPIGVMTGILRPDHGKDGSLTLTSRKQNDVLGDEGIYITVGSITVKTPLQESFYIHQLEKTKLRAVHYLSVGKLPFLTIDYDLTREQENEGQ